MPATRGPRPCAQKCGGKPVKKGHAKAKTKFNFFPDPKKGKGRCALKRPARAKSNEWKKVPYVRAKDAVQKQRMDRTAWKRKLADLLQATDAQLIRLLCEDRLLHDWTGKTCPRCRHLVKASAHAWHRNASTSVQPQRLPGIYQPSPPTYIQSSLMEEVPEPLLCKHSLLCSFCCSMASRTLPSIAFSTSTTRPLRTWRTG